MRELQAAIVKRDSTPEQRDAARKELARLLMSPAARASSSPLGEGKPRPRAAIEPFPSVPAPAAPLKVPMPGVAELEVVRAPKPVVIPQTGVTAATPYLPDGASQPRGNFAIDPRTGNILHGTGAAYIDPRTGQIIPR